jgi:Tol biopolymer transport system component
VSPHGSNASSEIWLWNADTDTALRVTTALDGVTASQGFADEGAMSDDGNWVTFRSTAKDLVSLLASGEPQIYQRNLQTGITRLVSVDTSGNGLNPECFDPAVSADGQVVAFRTPAAGFVADDANKVDDVFVTGPDGSGLRAASVRDPLAVSASAQALSFAGDAPVTADGRYVQFISRANDVVEGDTNGGEDVFLMDLVSGTPLLVSANTNGLPANGRSTEALVSEDGRFVAFVSRATDLATNALRDARNLYLRDRVENRTVLVTRTVNGDDSTNSLVLNSVSADGRWVLFTSGATNLVPGVQLKARWDRTWTSVYAYDRLAARISW